MTIGRVVESKQDWQCLLGSVSDVPIAPLDVQAQ